jgi:hypothetical protein
LGLCKRADSAALLQIEKLSFGDFAALDAVGANADALSGALNDGVDGLKVRAPATAGDVVGVRDVIAKLRAFAAKIAYLCHCPTPESLKISLSGIGAVAKAMSSQVHQTSERFVRSRLLKATTQKDSVLLPAR